LDKRTSKEAGSTAVVAGEEGVVAQDNRLKGILSNDNDTETSSESKIKILILGDDTQITEVERPDGIVVENELNTPLVVR